MRKSQAPSQLAKRPRIMTATRKKYPMYRAPTRVNVGKQAWPPQLVNTVRYVEAISITLTLGVGNARFTANGLYDPNQSGTGHQPMYFDQLMAVYDHYTVLKSKIKITPSYSGTLYFAAYVDDDTSGPSNFTSAMEYDESKGYLRNGAVSVFPPINLSWDAVKKFGPNPLANDNLQGTSSANPAEISTYYITVYDPSTPNTSMQCLVEMEFQVVWDEFATTSPS